MRFWWMFIFFAKTASSSDNELQDSNSEKESRFLPLFELKRYERPTPGLGPGGLPPLTQVPIAGERCSSRLESALDQMKRNKRNLGKDLDRPLVRSNRGRKSQEAAGCRRHRVGHNMFGSGLPVTEMMLIEVLQSQPLDLNGYSLHQPMRSAPVDMYVTRMRVRLPQNSKWVRVQKCYFDPRNVSLDTMLLFNDITISGNVDLFDANEFDRTLPPSRRLRRHYSDPYNYPRSRRNSGCNMILRLKKAGIGFHTRPLNQQPGKFNVKTDSEFVEPGFISVYAYGCERYINRNSNWNKDNLPLRRRKRSDEFAFNTNLEEPKEDILDGRSSDNWELLYEPRIGPGRSNYERSKLFRPDDDLDEIEDISREMEDIFTKGIRTLLTTYMKRELQPAIKDTLMKNMGYVVSYG